MKQLCLIFLLFIMSPNPSRAQENSAERLNEVIELQGQAKELKILKQAWVAYKLGDYKAAHSLWIPLAEAGNPSAQVFIGLMYNHGHYLQQDKNKAAKWYALASEQDFSPAEWRLAILYYHGAGLTQDYKKAADLYHSAAKQGDVYSQKALGFMYSKGFGVPKDNVLAYAWFYISSNNGFGLAQKHQKELSEELTPEEITIAQALAKQCMQSGYKTCGWTFSSAVDQSKDES